MTALVALLAAAVLAGEVPASPAPSDDEDLQALAATVVEAALRTEAIRGAPIGATIAAERADASRRRERTAGATPSLPPERLAARGRAWSDLALGGPGSPEALERILDDDLDAIRLHPVENSVLVDPDRLTSRDFGPEPVGSEGTSLLLATGVRPDEPTLVHALVHAMQRRQKRWPSGAETTDEALAQGAWLEGESTLVALLFLVDGVGLRDEVLAGRFDPVEACGGRLYPSAIGESDAAVAALARFVFQEGFYVSAEVVRRGGFQSLVPEARSRKTTRDLLHLDRPPSPPVRVDSGLDLPDGYRLADEDRLGEQAIVALVSILTGKDNLGLMAGDGWVGDALYRWERLGTGAADAGVTLSSSLWTSPDEAADFAYGIERTLQARFPGVLLEVAGQGRKRLSSGGKTYRLDTRGTRVDFRIAPDAVDSAIERGAAAPRPPSPSSKVKK